RMRLGNAIAAESEIAQPELRRSRANYPARHTVRRLEPRTFLTALNSQERTPHGRVPRRRIGVQGGIISRNWCKPFQHKRRYPPAPVFLGDIAKQPPRRRRFLLRH